MKPKKRQKLCHNCEGEIDVDVIVCPFCAADLREEKPEQSRSFQQSMQSSLYPPPYSKANEEEVSAPAAVVEADKKNIFAPTLLFSLGVQLFLLGILILLFSHKGLIVLKWDARFWFLYVFFSLPCLIVGYKSLSKL